MEISLNSTGSAGNQVERPIEGRIESVKDGVAQVRVTPTVVVQATLDSTGMEVGAKVALYPNSDGTLTAKSVATVAKDLQSQNLQILMDSLRTMLGDSTAGTLAKNLSRGDLDATRKQIAEIWQKVQAMPSEQVPLDLKAWVDKNAPALLSRMGEAPVVPGGSVAVAIGAQTSLEGEYYAQVAGQPAKLLGPSDLTQGPKGLWQSRQIPGGGAVWAPAPALRAEVAARPLAERVAANAEGAKDLLDWAGVQATPEETDSLGQFLNQVAQEFHAPNQDSGTGSAGRQNLVSRTPESVAGGVGKKDPVLLLDSLKLANDQSLPDTRGVLDGSQTSANAPLDLPKAVAQRALVAWSLDLPDNGAVRKAVLGEGPTVPEALGKLANLIASEPGAHPALEKLMTEFGSKDWIAPQGAKVHGQKLAMREKLAEAVFQALNRTDLSKEQAHLRQALQQTASALVQESLEPPRDRFQEYPPAVFQARTLDGTMDDGRIVVHDRRSKKREGDQSTDHHTVEIEMRPAELGPIKAKLDLHGKVLTTHLEARDADTATLLEAHADQLREAFKKIGLEPAKIEVERPKAAGKIDPRKRGSGTALDLRV